MEIPNNTAGRLLSILNEVKSQKPSTNAEVSWGEILDVPKGNRPLLLRRLGLVLDLPFQIEKQIKSISEIDDRPYLKWRGSVIQTFRQINLAGPIKAFQDQLKAEALYGLEICAEVLSRHFPDPIPDPNELESIDQEITNLMDYITESSLPPDIKSFLFERLDELHVAIIDYRFGGVTPIVRTVESTYGSIITSREVYEKARQDSEVHERFWSVMHKTASVASVSGGVGIITEKVLKLLGAN